MRPLPDPSSADAPPRRDAAEGVPEEVIAALYHYCSACWRNAKLPFDAWADATQSVLERLLERCTSERWNRIFDVPESEERREFMRAINTVEKRCVRGRQRWLRTLCDYSLLLLDRVSSMASSIAVRIDDLLEMLHILPERQQTILRMSLDGAKPQEIARALGMTHVRVADEKYKAIQKLRLAFAANDE